MIFDEKKKTRAVIWSRVVLVARPDLWNEVHSWKKGRPVFLSYVVSIHINKYLRYYILCIIEYIGGRVYPNRHILSLRTLGISWSKILGCCCCCSAAWTNYRLNPLKIPSSFFSWMDLISEIWTRHYHHPASNHDPRLFHFTKNHKCTFKNP